LFFGGQRLYFRDGDVYRRPWFRRRLFRNQRGRRRRLMWLARRLGRSSGRYLNLFRSRRRNDIEYDAIFDVHVAGDSPLDVPRSDVEILVQLGIEEFRI
jgi:hypothetical protein